MTPQSKFISKGHGFSIQTKYQSNHTTQNPSSRKRIPRSRGTIAYTCNNFSLFTIQLLILRKIAGNVTIKIPSTRAIQPKIVMITDQLMLHSL